MSVGLPESLTALKVVFGCLLLAIMVAMAIIDCRKMILPNRLNFLLASSGVAQAIFIGQPNLINAGLGALIGFVVLGTVAATFRNIRGVDGLGFGDQKFAAAAGLWIGWEEVATMLLIASLSALVFVTIRFAKEQKFDMAARLPFGPFLGLGTFVSWSATIALGS